MTTMMRLQEQLDRLQVKMTEKGDDVASWTQKRTDEAAEALLKLETDQEFSIGCLRRELETIWGKESSNAKDAVKEAKKISDRIDSFPPLSAATWRDWWTRTDRELALFSTPELRGMLVWSALPKHLQQGVRSSNFAKMAREGTIPRKKQYAYLKVVLQEFLGVPCLRTEAKYSLDNFVPMAAKERLVQLFSRLRITMELYLDLPLKDWSGYQRREFLDSLRRYSSPDIGSRLDATVFQSGEVGDIETHISSLDLFINKTPKVKGFLEESLPLTLRSKKAVAAPTLAKLSTQPPTAASLQPETVSMPTWPGSNMEVNTAAPHPGARRDGGKPRPQWSKDSKKYGGGAAPKRTCISCGDKNCPRCCVHCKERGHIAARCPKKRAGSREEPAAALPPLMATTNLVTNPPTS